MKLIDDKYEVRVLTGRNAGKIGIVYGTSGGATMKGKKYPTHYTYLLVRIGDRYENYRTFEVERVKNG